MVMQTTEKTEILASPKVTLENLEKTIIETQEQIESLESRLKDFEESGDYALIQSEKIFDNLTTLRNQLEYYQKQIPVVQARLEAFNRLQARDKALVKLESTNPRLKELISDYNSAREQMIIAQRQLCSLDRELSRSVVLATNRGNDTIFVANDFIEPQTIPFLSIQVIDQIPSIYFLEKR